VLNDLDFLATLAPDFARAGMSEAVKVALIRDAAFFRWTEESAARLAARDADAVEYLVRRCAQLHLRHIASGGDPFELGSARPLDFGHWAAHKLESLTGNRLSHGDAVAIGLALDTVYSSLTGHLDPADAERVLALLEALGFRLWDPGLDAVDADGRPRVLTGIAEFREHLGGELSITLLRGVGIGFEAREIDEPRMRDAIDHLRRRDRARCG
jgi:3-dehydroquinate synthase